MLMLVGKADGEKETKKILTAFVPAAIVLTLGAYFLFSGKALLAFVMGIAFSALNFSLWCWLIALLIEGSRLASDAESDSDKISEKDSGYQNQDVGDYIVSERESQETRSKGSLLGGVLFALKLPMLLGLVYIVSLEGINFLGFFFAGFTALLLLGIFLLPFAARFSRRRGED